MIVSFWKTAARSSARTSVPPRKTTIFWSAIVYSGSSWSASGMGGGCCAICCAWPYAPGGPAAIGPPIAPPPPVPKAPRQPRSASTHVFWSLRRAASKPFATTVSSACFASRLLSASMSTDEYSSAALAVTGATVVITRMRRSPDDDV